MGVIQGVQPARMSGLGEHHDPVARVDGNVSDLAGLTRTPYPARLVASGDLR